MSSSECRILIEQNYDKLTSTEKIVGDFFLTENEKVDNTEAFEATRVAEKLHVSQAALSRFSKKLGFAGYRQFIYEMRHESRSEGQFMNGLVHRVSQAYDGVVSKTIEGTSMEQISNVAREIVKEGRRIYIFGLGSSGLSATELALRLSRCGIDARAVCERHEMLICMKQIKATDLVIGVSLSGESVEIVNLLDSAFELGAFTVYITSKLDTSMVKASEIIRSAPLEQIQMGAVISPQIPILIIFDYLYGQCLDLLPEGTVSKSLWEEIKGNKARAD